LAAHRLRQIVDELDLSWVLVGRRDALHMVLNLLSQVFGGNMLRSQLDERLDDAATSGIRARHDGRLQDRRMCEQSAFDLEWADAIAGGNDHVVATTDKPEVSLLVAVRAISGQVVLPPPARGALGGILPVLEK